jgi:hypothetical protein
VCDGEKLVGNCLLGISTAHVTWRSFLVPGCL